MVVQSDFENKTLSDRIVCQSLDNNVNVVSHESAWWVTRDFMLFWIQKCTVFENPMLINCPPSKKEEGKLLC